MKRSKLISILMISMTTVILSSQAYSMDMAVATHQIGTEQHQQYVCCRNEYWSSEIWVPRGEHKITSEVHPLLMVCFNEGAKPGNSCNADTQTYLGRDGERFEDRLLRITRQLTTADPEHKGSSSYKIDKIKYWKGWK